MAIDFDSNIVDLSGIGPKYAKNLQKLSINTVGELLKHYPSKYLDFSHQTPIKNIKESQLVCIKAYIDKPKSFFSRNGKLITEGQAKDKTGEIKLIWFNSPYINRTIKNNLEYFICGKTSTFADKLCLIAPTFEPTSNSTIHTQGFVPIYPQTAGITSKWLRSRIKQGLDFVPKDPLSPKILQKNDLENLEFSYNSIHFPRKNNDHLLADKRLAFNQHLLINLNNQIELQNLPPSPAIGIDNQLHQKSIENLPFKPTNSQIKAISHLYTDLSTTKYSHRLVTGETGSGKTAVLIFAANQCLNAGYSFVLMAPTQILAEQHATTFSRLSLFPNKISLVSGASRLKISNTPQIYIGTQALIHQLPQKLKYPVACIAIDEQHKFGVEDRQILLQRTPTPHLINLSATPIPRTMALGLFGEIKTSTLKSKPKNRLNTKTWLVTPKHFQKSQNWISENLKQNQKIFVVCPLIQNSAKTTLSSIEKYFEEYKKTYGKIAPVLKLHGQMPLKEKQATIEQFSKIKAGILVSTPIVEVGVDIPDTNIIIIHSAERFGLAQLHQLRGRVGRGGGQGYCMLVPTTDDLEESERLNLLNHHQSGMVLAKLDLKLRGAGELFGLKQHGHLPTRLKYFWDRDLYSRAKKYAKELLLLSPKKALDLVSGLNHC